MRVLLLGGTGNLGLRCIPALLAHQHSVTLYVRNPSKLQRLVSPSLLSRAAAVVVGDATDSSSIQKAIQDHDVEAIIDVAGNQVYPWREFLLPKIAKAVADAALAVGKERGAPLRVWVVCGLNALRYPGTPNEHLIQDYIFPRMVYAQHEATRAVIEHAAVSELRWSLLCVALMQPANAAQGVFDLLEAPSPHDLLLKATSPPAWENTWVMRIPWIGPYVNLWAVVLGQYTTRYEAVADFLAEDLETGSEEWVGKKVAMKEKEKIKDA